MPDGDEVQFKSPTTGTVQVVLPEHWDEALKLGYTPTTHKVMYSPEGQRGMVPNDQLVEKTRAGYRYQPSGQELSAQDIKDLQEIAGKLPPGHPMGPKINRLLSSQPTQFEKEHPGHGITTEGMGTAAFEGFKGLGKGLFGILDPTAGLSGAGLTSVGLNPREGTVGKRLAEVPIIRAGQETKAAWERGGIAPSSRFSGIGRIGESMLAGAGSLFGESAESAARHAERGEGGAILGEAVVPAATAAIGELIHQGGPAVRRSIGASKALEPVPTRSIGNVIETPSKLPAYAVRKVFPEPRERIAAREGSGAAAEPIGSRIISPSAGASEPRFIGSEGRAATWTNETVMRLARQGNREAIQQAIRRGMELPAGARYVMGDPDFSRSLFNPRETTKFTPEGVPILNSAEPVPPVQSAQPARLGGRRSLNGPPPMGIPKRRGWTRYLK